MNIEIFKNSKDYDSDDIHLMDKEKGFAYIGRAGQNLGLIRCPVCGRENYAMSVSSGQCAWCSWDVNSIKEAILKQYGN